MTNAEYMTSSWLVALKSTLMIPNNWCKEFGFLNSTSSESLNLLQKCAMRYFTLSPPYEIFGFLGCYSTLENGWARTFREPLLVPTSWRLYNPTGLRPCCQELITTHINPYITIHPLLLGVLLSSFNLWRWDQLEFPKCTHPTTFQRCV
jgi:hypothetical protein